MDGQPAMGGTVRSRCGGCICNRKRGGREDSRAASSQNLSERKGGDRESTDNRSCRTRPLPARPGALRRYLGSAPCQGEAASSGPTARSSSRTRSALLTGLVSAVQSTWRYLL